MLEAAPRGAPITAPSGPPVPQIQLPHPHYQSRAPPWHMMPPLLADWLKASGRYGTEHGLLYWPFTHAVDRSAPGYGPGGSPASMYHYTTHPSTNPPAHHPFSMQPYPTHPHISAHMCTHPCAHSATHQHQHQHQRLTWQPDPSHYTRMHTTPLPSVPSTPLAPIASMPTAPLAPTRMPGAVGEVGLGGHHQAVAGATGNMVGSAGPCVCPPMQNAPPDGEDGGLTQQQSMAESMRFYRGRPIGTPLWPPMRMPKRRREDQE